MTPPVPPTVLPDGVPVPPEIRAGISGAMPEAGLLGRWIFRGGYLFAAGLVLAAAILLVEVFLRYVLNAPTRWAHETTTTLCALAFLYGGLFCAARNSHIRVVLIYDMLSGRARRALEAVIAAVSALASGMFAYAAWTMADRALYTPGGEFRPERSGSSWNPPTPALIKTFLLIVMLALTVQFLIMAINHARRFRQGDPL
ncbi:MAG: TRAP transporter small permease subunit [Paracoccus sp. (in: a-proteobacteria)]|uniref:TRAP transporter small permease subunit n=1 Tax=Paracoccus sp. TaxID=267 RepID=UPI00391B68D8